MKLNLACGLDVKEGWVNLDVIPRWPGAPRACDKVWDARSCVLPFEDNSADEIYAGYLLLHLSHMYHRSVLAEIRRVLSPGGTLRIGEVNMRAVMERWLKDQDDESSSVLIWGEQGLYRGATLGEYDKHCRGFTRESLMATLFKAGFSGFKEIKIHGPDVYYELTVECKKDAVAPPKSSFVSVVVPTMRIGGLDVLFEGLKAQTTKGFELVLVDALYDRRKELIDSARTQYPFDIVHLPPGNNRFPLNTYCHSVNTGLGVARGPIILNMSDYSWPDPSCVESHAEFHFAHNGESVALAQPYGLSVPLPTKPSLRVYGPGYLMVDQNHDEHYRRMDSHSYDYERDVKNGSLDEYMWSIYPSQPTLSRIASSIWELSKPGRTPEGPCDDVQCNLRNESFRLEDLLRVNGLDEDLDGAHGWQDSDLSDRLVKSGVRWWSRQSGAVWICKPFDKVNVRRLEGSFDPRRNERIWTAKKESGFAKPANPSFSLIKNREQRTK